MSILNAVIPYGLTALPLVGSFSLVGIFKTQSHANLKVWYKVNLNQILFYQ